MLLELLIFFIVFCFLFHRFPFSYLLFLFYLYPVYFSKCKAFAVIFKKRWAGFIILIFFWNHIAPIMVLYFSLLIIAQFKNRSQNFSTGFCQTCFLFVFVFCFLSVDDAFGLSSSYKGWLNTSQPYNGFIWTLLLVVTFQLIIKCHR